MCKKFFKIYLKTIGLALVLSVSAQGNPYRDHKAPTENECRMAIHHPIMQKISQKAYALMMEKAVPDDIARWALEREPEEENALIVKCPYCFYRLLDNEMPLSQCQKFDQTLGEILSEVYRKAQQ